MSDHVELRTAAVERHLERRPQAGPAPELRHRVLMAVDDVLAERRPRPGDDGTGVPPAWAWAAATALGITAALPLLDLADSMRRGEPIAVVRRLEAAGIDDPALLAAFAAADRPGDVVPAARRSAELPPPRPMPRMIEARRLLEENL